MLFAILRHKRLKIHQLHNVDKHNNRMLTSDWDKGNINYDKTVNNKTFPNPNYEGDSLEDLINERLDLLETRPKIINTGGKNDTVVAVEIIATASPDFFDDEANDYEYKLNQWIESNIKYFKELYQENYITAHLHLDEKTPHIHVLVTPLNAKERTKRRTRDQIAEGLEGVKYKTTVFDCKNLFSRETLRLKQTDYAKLMKREFGLERGVKNSEDKTLKRYHKPISEMRREQKIELDLGRIALENNDDTLKNQQLKLNEGDNLLKHLSFLENCYSQLEEKYYVLKENNSRLVKEIPIQEDKNRRLEESISRLLEQRSVLEANNSRLEANNSRLGAENSRLGADNSRLLEQRSVLEADNSRLLEQLSALENKIKNKNSLYQKIESLIDKYTYVTLEGKRVVRQDYEFYIDRVTKNQIRELELFNTMFRADNRDLKLFIKNEFNFDPELAIKKIREDRNMDVDNTRDPSI